MKLKKNSLNIFPVSYMSEQPTNRLTD